MIKRTSSKKLKMIPKQIFFLSRNEKKNKKKEGRKEFVQRQPPEEAVALQPQASPGPHLPPQASRRGQGRAKRTSGAENAHPGRVSPAPRGVPGSFCHCTMLPEPPPLLGPQSVGALSQERGRKGAELGGAGASGAQVLAGSG